MVGMPHAMYIVLLSAGHGFSYSTRAPLFVLSSWVNQGSKRSHSLLCTHHRSAGVADELITSVHAKVVALWRVRVL